MSLQLVPMVNLVQNKAMVLNIILILQTDRKRQILKVLLTQTGNWYVLPSRLNDNKQLILRMLFSFRKKKNS